jgi:hypothetical protein
MEFPVFDALSRKITMFVALALCAPALAIFYFAGLSPQGKAPMPAELLLVLSFPVAVTLAVVPFLNIMFGVRIRIERATGEVFRIYSLFGGEVRRQSLPLSGFDRVSLSRGFRGGYRVSLLGREHDLMACMTAKLSVARERANKLATECGLKVCDQL